MEEKPPLSRQKTLETFKKQQEIQMKHMDEMLRGMRPDQQMGEDGQM